jgi:hypothetical protein
MMNDGECCGMQYDGEWKRGFSLLEVEVEVEERREEK